MSGSNILIPDKDLMQASELQEKTLSLQNIGNDGNRTVTEYLPDDDFEDFEHSNTLNDAKEEIKNRTVNENSEKTFKNIDLQKQMNLFGKNPENKKLPSYENENILSWQDEDEHEDAGNRAVFENLMSDLKAPAKPPRNMDEALDTLWTIEGYLDEATKEKLDFKTESGFWGMLKNAFCKFLGVFNKSFEENRTRKLNDAIDSVVRKISQDIQKHNEFGKSLRKNVLIPVMNDEDIDEELKTTCFRLFKHVPSFQKELFQELNAPNADITFDVLDHWKKEIKNGKLFGEDVCERWLSPLMNDETFSMGDKIKLYELFNDNPEIQDKLFRSLREPHKIKLYELFNDNPEIQDKLFRSLREPPKEIKEKFWNKNEAKIKDGSFLGIQNPVKQWTKEEFVNVIGNPLSKILLSELEDNSTLEPSYFTKPETINLIHTEEDLKWFFKAHSNLMNRPGYMEQVAKNMFEEYSRTKKSDQEIEKLKENIANFKSVLSNEALDLEVLEKCKSPLLFEDLYRGEGGNSSVTFDFGNRRTIVLSQRECLDANGRPSKLAVIETIRKQIKSNKLTDEEIERLADFATCSQGQGYWAPIKNEAGVAEHAFNLNVSFEKTGTKVTLPLNGNDISFKSRFSSLLEGFCTLCQKFNDYDDVCNEIPMGKYMQGTMEIVHEGTSLINAKETTTFHDFHVTVPNF